MTDPTPTSTPTPNHVLLLHPEQLIFTHVRVGQTYSQCIRITNPLELPISCSIKPGNTSRYSVGGIGWDGMETAYIM